MKKDEAYELYKARLEKLAREKTEASRKAAEERAQRQLAAMGAYSDLSNGGPFAREFRRMFHCLKLDGCGYWVIYEATASVREPLIQYLMFKKALSYDEWFVVDAPDATQPDEENLCCKIVHWYKFRRDDYEPREYDIEDLLIVLGKIARRIKSPLLSRITQLMVDFDQFRVVSSREEATRMVDDFIACVRQVKKETLLLEDDEAAKVWPERPRHEVSDDLAIDTSGMTAAEAMEASIKLGRDIYRKNTHDLMRPEGANADTPHPMMNLVNFIKDMAENVKKGRPDDSYQPLDTTLLTRVLGAKLQIEYEEYHESDNGPVANDLFSYEDTEEERLREEIIDDLDRYLYRATDLAKTIGSRAYEDLALCQSLAVKRDWNFCAYADCDAMAVAADLKIFIDALERARPVLWADCANYKPPKTTTPEPAKIDKGDSKIGKACSSFVTYFSKKEHIIKMRVRVAGDIAEATFKIASVNDDKKLLNVVAQLVSADAFPIKLDNPWAPSPLNLSSRFRMPKTFDASRSQFYQYIYCVGRGCKARYELRSYRQITSKKKRPVA